MSSERASYSLFFWSKAPLLWSPIKAVIQMVGRTSASVLLCELLFWRAALVSNWSWGNGRNFSHFTLKWFTHTLDQWREPLQNSNACFSSPNCWLSGSSAAVGLWTTGKIEAGEVIRSSWSSTDPADEHQAGELLWQRMQCVIFLLGTSGER